MNHARAFEQYRLDGEERFDNFSGQRAYPEERYYQDGEEYELVEVDEGYDSYAANSIGQLDPNDTTYTFVVKNTGVDDKEVVLFGANEAIPAPDGVTIEVAESSHNEVREESKSNPFTIVGMKMSVSNSQQFDNVLFIYEKTSGGRLTTYVKQPRNYQSPQNFDQKLIHATDFTMKVTGKSSLRFKAKPGTTVFTFSVQTRTNIGNVLEGRNVAEVNTAPQVTGLPQLDLTRLKQPATLAELAPKPAIRKVKLVKPNSVASMSQAGPTSFLRRA